MRTFLACAAIMLPLAAAADDVEFRTVTGGAHFAEVWLHNSYTVGPTEVRHTFEVDGMPVVVINRRVPNGAPDPADFLFIESLPPHVEADALEIAVDEKQSGVIRLFWKVMG